MQKGGDFHDRVIKQLVPHHCLVTPRAFGSFMRESYPASLLNVDGSTLVTFIPEMQVRSSSASKAGTLSYNLYCVGTA
jgi:hypothetical protein